MKTSWSLAQQNSYKIDTVMEIKSVFQCLLYIYIYISIVTYPYIYCIKSYDVFHKNVCLCLSCYKSMLETERDLDNEMSFLSSRIIVVIFVGCIGVYHGGIVLFGGACDIKVVNLAKSVSWRNLCQWITLIWITISIIKTHSLPHKGAGYAITGVGLSVFCLLATFLTKILTDLGLIFRIGPK